MAKSLLRASERGASVGHLRVPRLEARIHALRGQRVMLSHDLADLYGVAPRLLNQAVKRNRSRFPADFLFQLTRTELASLKSQSVTSSWGGARRAMPYAFTEQGVAMLSSVLRSPRSVRVNIEIMRAFVRLRQLLGSNAELARKLDALEKRYDSRFRVVFQAIRELMLPPVAPAKRIGFKTEGSPHGGGQGARRHHKTARPCRDSLPN